MVQWRRRKLPLGRACRRSSTLLLLISSGSLQIPERRTCKMTGDRWTIVAVEPSFFVYVKIQYSLKFSRKIFNLAACSFALVCRTQHRGVMAPGRYVRLLETICHLSRTFGLHGVENRRSGPPGRQAQWFEASYHQLRLILHITQSQSLVAGPRNLL